MFKIRHLLPLAALAAVLSYAEPSSAETIIDEWQSVKAPPAPQLKSVTLDPKTTALLVIDMIKQTCNENSNDDQSSHSVPPVSRGGVVRRQRGLPVDQPVPRVRWSLPAGQATWLVLPRGSTVAGQRRVHTGLR